MHNLRSAHDHSSTAVQKEIAYPYLSPSCLYFFDQVYIMPAYSTLSQGSFGLATAYTGYLVYRTLLPPQARRRDESGEVLDNLGGDRFFLAAALYRTLFLSLATWQGLVCYNRDFAPATDPRYPMNEIFLTWNKVSIAALTFICTGSLIRLRAFQELGKNFTFELHEPDELNTRGLYKYVQHPSYTGTMAMIGAALWFFRGNSVLASILPEAILKHQQWLNMLIPSVPFLAGCFIIPMRVKDEEAMLQKKFGKEWEDWNARTPRFFPFLF